jgi:hypothetical protein
MNQITYIQMLELIDLAAAESRLYHYNGGQAYIRVSMSLNVLMIIDHTSKDKINIELMDGTQYFLNCAGYNESVTRYGKLGDTLVEWYTKKTQLVELDRV